MPKVYRSMRADGERPELGRSSAALGIRLPDPTNPNAPIDIMPNADGVVLPGTGGMSVAPSPRQLRNHQIPRRLRSLYPKATGSDKLKIWCMGAGPFADGAFADNLALRVDSERHGVIEPAVAMHVDQFDKAIAATRDAWQVDEGAVS